MKLYVFGLSFLQSRESLMVHPSEEVVLYSLLVWISDDFKLAQINFENAESFFHYITI